MQVVGFVLSYAYTYLFDVANMQQRVVALLCQENWAKPHTKEKPQLTTATNKDEVSWTIFTLIYIQSETVWKKSMQNCGAKLN